MKFLTICTAAALLLVASLAISCSDDDGGGTLSLDEYFQKLDEFQNDVDAKFNEQEADAAEPAEDASEEDLADYARSSIEDSAKILSDASGDAQDVNAPDEAAEAHEHLLTALGDVTDALHQAADDVPDTLSYEELVSEDATWFDSAELTAAFADFDAACVELQTLADDNSIAVDLECEE